MRSSRLLLLASLLFLEKLHGLTSTAECCQRKLVGGLAYFLWGTHPGALEINCKSHCVYTRDNAPSTGPKYCFGIGTQESRCLHHLHTPEPQSSGSGPHLRTPGPQLLGSGLGSAPHQPYTTPPPNQTPPSQLPHKLHATTPSPFPAPTAKDNVIMLTGGYGNGHVNLVLLYPPLNCSLPPLPSHSYFHRTFLTQSNLLATCDAWENSGSISCLVLNTTSRLWETDIRMPGPLRIGSSNHGNVAITIPDTGVYLFGNFQDPARDSEPGLYLVASVLLRPGATSWVSGPSLPEWAPISWHYLSNSCIVHLPGQGSLLVIHESQQVWEYRLESSTWAPKGTWPLLLEERIACKCSVIGDTVIIVGGRALVARISTEIIDITKKTIKFGGELSTGRYDPYLVTFNNMLYAIGGSLQAEFGDIVEVWMEETEEWRPVAGGLEKKLFGGVALVVPLDVVCPTATPITNHSPPVHQASSSGSGG